jgi:broad specificity phosphatase PhoE
MIRFLTAIIGAGILSGAAGSADSKLDLYLARHGQTDWNLEGRLQGTADLPLNPTGRRQAVTLERRLAGLHLDAVYSSELRRSRETAETVHGRAPLTSLAGLNERRLGIFEGGAANADYLRRSQDPVDELDGGESLNQFFVRIQTTLQRILTRHRSGTVLIVGHGGTNQMIVRILFDLSAERAATFQQANEDLYLCEISSGKAQRLWKLIDPHDKSGL